MGPLFGILAGLNTIAMVAALFIGHFLIFLGLTARDHMLLGLGSAIFASLLHCLVFAIFTGSGKDARLLVERLGLNAEYTATVRRFRREIFPPALKAIGALLVMAVLGGALGSSNSSGGVLRVLHPLVAWFAVAYNGMIFWREFKIICANSEFIAKVNADAAATVRQQDSPVQGIASFTDAEFSTTAHAMGRFFCFLGVNLWLPYLYLRFAMSLFWVSWAPFLAASILFYGVGTWLKHRYRLDIIG